MFTGGLAGLALIIASVCESVLGLVLSVTILSKY